MLILALHFYLLLISLILLLLETDGLAVVSTALIFASIEMYLWAWREGRYKTLNWCSPIPVFVLGYCIVFYQLPFCSLAGLELSYYSNYVLFAPQNIAYCVLLAASGLSAFFCGEQFFFLKKKNFRACAIKTSIPKQQLPNYYIRIKRANSIILSLSVLFFLLFLRSFGSFNSFLGFAYGNWVEMAEAGATHFNFASVLFLYLSILLELSRLVHIKPKSLKAYIRAWDKRVLIVAAITLTPFILSGDRGSYLQPMALIVAPYFLFVKPLSFKHAAAAVIALAFIMVTIGETRMVADKTWEQSLTAQVESVYNPAQWPTMELANSFGTFNIATDYFPEKYSYNKGVNILFKLASLIPFFSGLTGLDKINVQNNYIYASSLFFTNIITRGTFSSGSGTSSLADIYMDFGPYGIPVILFLWGVFMAWICHKAVTTHSAIFVFLYAYYSYFSIYVNRSSFFFGWNQFLWVILLFYLIRRVYLAQPK